jgi:glucose-6-phosphate dehydrogenase assembly protein OpcA
MFKADIKINKVYAAKVSNNLVPVRILEVCRLGNGWIAQNLQTSRIIRIRSAQKLRFELIQLEETELWFSKRLIAVRLLKNAQNYLAKQLPDSAEACIVIREHLRKEF